MFVISALNSFRFEFRHVHFYDFVFGVADFSFDVFGLKTSPFSPPYLSNTLCSVVFLHGDVVAEQIPNSSGLIFGGAC